RLSEGSRRKLRCLFSKASGVSRGSPAMNRSLKLSILLALALGSSQAAAVELGQAHIKSALGQPLLVDIPVTKATPDELQSLSAQLAPNDAFVKAGGARPAIPLQFNVVDDN